MTNAAAIAPLQRALMAAGFLPELASNGTPNDDGVFGLVTRAAMQAYQAARIPPLEQTAFPDAATYSALGLEIPDFAQPQPKGLPMPNILSWFNNSVILGILRNILMAAGAVLVTKGVIDNATLVEIVGAIMAIISAILSGISNNTKSVNTAIVKAVEAHRDITVIPASETALGKPIVSVAK